MAAKKKTTKAKPASRMKTKAKATAGRAKAAIRRVAKKATKTLDGIARRAASDANQQARDASAKRKATSAAKAKAAPARPAPKAAKPAARPAVVKAVSASAPAAAVATGQEAPEVSLPGDDGQVHTLSAHRGQPVVLYFYPKDATPGCTQEACDFRDNLARAQARGAVVYGVSRDSVASHAKFRAQHGLNFPLLSDESLAAHHAYGTWGKKKLYGREFEGTIRSTFLIDRQGRIARIWPKVSVTGHVDEVLSAIEALPA